MCSDDGNIFTKIRAYLNKSEYFVAWQFFSYFIKLGQNNGNESLNLVKYDFGFGHSKILTWKCEII